VSTHCPYYELKFEALDNEEIQFHRFFMVH
jgi:hypothetical protein